MIFSILEINTFYYKMHQSYKFISYFSIGIVIAISKALIIKGQKL